VKNYEEKVKKKEISEIFELPKKILLEAFLSQVREANHSKGY